MVASRSGSSCAPTGSHWITFDRPLPFQVHWPSSRRLRLLSTGRTPDPWPGFDWVRSFPPPSTSLGRPRRGLRRTAATSATLRALGQHRESALWDQPRRHTPSALRPSRPERFAAFEKDAAPLWSLRYARQLIFSIEIRTCSVRSSLGAAAALRLPSRGVVGGST